MSSSIIIRTISRSNKPLLRSASLPSSPHSNLLIRSLATTSPVVKKAKDFRLSKSEHSVSPADIARFITEGQDVVAGDAAASTKTNQPRPLQRSLPRINASALLDPKTFVKQPGSSISGGHATHKLLQGRSTLLDVLKQEVGNVEASSSSLSFLGNSGSSSSSSSSTNHHPPAYVVEGHGIPPQLLQHLLDMGDSLLRGGANAQGTSFQNFHGELDFEWLRIRNHSGANRAVPWAHIVKQHQQRQGQGGSSSGDLAMDMQLYLTVMNRLACHLSLGLNPEDSIYEDDDDDDNYDFGSATTNAQQVPTQPSHWNAEVWRGWHYPAPLVSSSTTTTSQQQQQTAATTTTLDPIVEWIPRRGLAAPGHVCIRLQGYPQQRPPAAVSAAPKWPFLQQHSYNNKNKQHRPARRPKRQPVTLVFDACFRNKVQVVPHHA